MARTFWICVVLALPVLSSCKGGDDSGQGVKGALDSAFSVKQPAGDRPSPNASGGVTAGIEAKPAGTIAQAAEHDATEPAGDQEPAIDGAPAASDDAPFGGPGRSPPVPTCEGELGMVTKEMYTLEDRVAFERANVAAAAGGKLPPVVARPTAPPEAEGCKSRIDWARSVIKALKEEQKELLATGGD